MTDDSMPAWGTALATVTDEGQVLDAWFPTGCLGLGTTPLDAPRPAGATTGPVRLPGLSRIAIDVTPADLRAPAEDTADAYLRLHLLSHRLVRPNAMNLDGLFGLLPNVAWTSAGPCPPERVDELRLSEWAADRTFAVRSVDKFPPMTDYVVPSGVRIADAGRVRLGAYLSAGTTIMQEGFCNFNAGTLGASMVEGRISQGVVVGDGSDIGGGASIMGSLSGGGRERISLGERCLLGANSGIGISLGDDCVVEAGCYITAGAKVTLPDGRMMRALELSGQSNLLYWRHSETGQLQARPRTGPGIALNPIFHAND